ncbi:MAG: SlyX family protein [Paracoccaceae bacterium]
MNDERLERLEHLVADLQRAADDLSDTVAAQSREIDRLTARVEMLLRREAEREAQGGAVVLGDERPPHY